MEQYTPMIRQYLQIKADYPDAFLFFRLGDFYEMFFDDAIKASQELEITLTGRDGGLEERIPMCGVPYHAAQSYIETLVEKGYKVAICEQMEDPKTAKGVVKREVIQLITPGTLVEGKTLLDKRNHYIASIQEHDRHTFAFTYIDLSTGESRAAIIDEGWTAVLDEVSTIEAKEIVVSSDFPREWRNQLKERGVVTVSEENETAPPASFENRLSGLTDESLKICAARLVRYLERTQKRSLDHIRPFEVYQVRQYMAIDYFSKRNLELTETIRTKGKRGSLLWLLDETRTAMGGRLLKQWLDRPLLSRDRIEERLRAVEVLKNHYFEREQLREYLKKVYDIERLAGKVALGTVNARDLVSLKTTLRQIPEIITLLCSIPDEELKERAGRMDPCRDVADEIEAAIVDDPPVSVKEGNMIREGYHAELDRFRDASKNGKKWIAELEKREREKTGIKSLKVGYNRVFGYYIEVTKANLHLLKDGMYERKQTLANAERFVTPELKEMESIILEAEEKIVGLEYDLFCQIREKVKAQIGRLQKLAREIAELDCLQCFATISEERRYVRPTFNNERRLKIINGRHPVVEKVMDSQMYVPNDCLMDGEREILLITGPNMSGKSTYMRQVALISILAQIGCFVPADEADLPIFDQIFTRIGASDDLVSGQSTFMVEMLEAKNAICNATENSLILFDEIGRGTSTYDGIALARAMIEYIHNRIGAKTLFSTHYHELTSLERQLPKLKNIHVSAVEQQGRVVFLHKIKEGPTDKSYGIQVARLADLPEEVIQRASDILKSLEKGNMGGEKEKAEEKPEAESFAQLSFFPDPPAQKEKEILGQQEQKVLKELKSLNLLEMTPLDAMNALFRLQKKLNG